MEQALQLWGPAAVILTVLIVIIKWFMSFIDGQAKRIEKMTEDANSTQLKMAEAFTATIQEHMLHSIQVMTEAKTAICDLKQYLLKSNGQKSGG